MKTPMYTYVIECLDYLYVFIWDLMKNLTLNSDCTLKVLLLYIRIIHFRMFLAFRSIWLTVSCKFSFFTKCSYESKVLNKGHMCQDIWHKIPKERQVLGHMSLQFSNVTLLNSSSLLAKIYSMAAKESLIFGLGPSTKQTNQMNIWFLVVWLEENKSFLFIDNP